MPVPLTPTSPPISPTTPELPTPEPLTQGPNIPSAQDEATLETVTSTSHLAALLREGNPGEWFKRTIHALTLSPSLAPSLSTEEE